MKKYSILLLAGIFIILLMLSVFNWLINPYDIFASPEIKDINTYKISVERSARLSKVYQIDRIKPNNILLASSKGMVVPGSFFANQHGTGFNSSLLGASTYELLRMMQHAQSVNHLKRVVLALDEEFTSGVGKTFSEERLAVNYNGEINQNRWSGILKDYSQSILGSTAFRASLRTLNKQKEDPELIGIEAYQLNRVVNSGGHRYMFRIRESNVLADSVIDNYQNCMNWIPADGLYNADGAEYFSNIVDIAYQNNIELHIYFPPVHARYYEAMCMAGKWTTMEKMKRMVVDIVDKKSQEYGRPIYPVWDFSGYSQVTTEDVPSYEDKHKLMNGYWDDSHYTVKTAKLIFNRLFNRGNDADKFGVYISRDNIDKHLQNIRHGRISYINNHSEDIAELKEIMKNYTNN